jgi:hypothetical protein
MMSRKSKRFSVLIAPVLVVVAIMVIASQSSSASSPYGTSTKRSVGLRHTFAVLDSTRARAAAVLSQPLPAVIVKSIEQPGSGLGRFGLHANEAVFTGGTYPTWVVPGAGHVCLVVGSIETRGVPGASCASTAQAEAGELTMLTETDAGAPIVLGLAPNTNKSITVTNTDGATHSVPVTNNVYEIHSGTPATVDLKSILGSKSTDEVKLPPPPPTVGAPAEPTQG